MVQVKLPCCQVTTLSAPRESETGCRTLLIYSFFQGVNTPDLEFWWVKPRIVNIQGWIINQSLTPFSDFRLHCHRGWLKTSPVRSEALQYSLIGLLLPIPSVLEIIRSQGPPAFCRHGLKRRVHAYAWQSRSRWWYLPRQFARASEKITYIGSWFNWEYEINTILILPTIKVILACLLSVYT
jgi:hypothetical protein